MTLKQGIVNILQSSMLIINRLNDFKNTENKNTCKN